MSDWSKTMIEDSGSSVDAPPIAGNAPRLKIDVPITEAFEMELAKAWGMAKKDAPTLYAFREDFIRFLLALGMAHLRPKQ